MKIVLISNFFNQHMEGISDELFRVSDFTFIETQKMPDSFINNGYLISNKKYILKSYLSDANNAMAIDLIVNCDVLIYGSCPEEMIKYRRNQNGKITFRYSERLFKHTNNFLKYRLLLHPRSLFKEFLRNYYFGKKEQEYLLCASSFSKGDFNFTGKYIGKCYKWGYFPKIVSHESLIKKRNQNQKIRICWIGRFIDWKHPDTFLRLIRYLDKLGYVAEAIMIGTGPLKKILMDDLKNNHLVNVSLTLMENVQNDDVRKQLSQSDICVITSDFNEGWGCVLNEAMAAKCAIVCSSAIGSSKYLIKHKNSAYIYRWKNETALKRMVLKLMKNEKERKKIGFNAYSFISNEYSPYLAAHNLLMLSKALIAHKKFKVKNGPCSKA